MPIEDGLCRSIAIALTERPSVTGTADEASFGPWLADYLAGLGVFGENPEIWTFPVAPGDGRTCVALLVRRSGEACVLLTGHYDTVTVADYGDLEPLAIRPEALAPAFARRVEGAAAGSAEARARDDLASGAYLPGRGLLDMKAGLAAGFTAMAAFATEAEATGNLLFIALPDEENASAGAIRAAADLAALAVARRLRVTAAINLDAIADDGDGSAGRVMALGSVGKVLPTAFVVGTPVHSGFPLRGLNAAVLAGAIAARLEWAPELTDESAEAPGTPISLLSLRDGKTGYDVTTPATAFVTWSVLNTRRKPSTVLDTVETLVREALDTCVADLRARARTSGQPSGEVPGVPVLRYARLEAEVRAHHPGLRADLDALADRLRHEGHAIPEICRRLTAAVWHRSGRSGPTVVLGLGSMPYLAVEIADAALRHRLEAFVREAGPRLGVSLETVEFFAGISDVSFFGEGDASEFERLAEETPAWATSIALGDRSLAGVPTVNLGPWGRDYHTPLERIETRYGFDILPRLVLDLATTLL